MVMNFKQTQLQSESNFLNQHFKDLLFENDIIINEADSYSHLSKLQQTAFGIF